MIKNERQYRITKAQADKFQDALNRLTNRPAAKDQVHPLLRKAEEEALRSQLDELRAELEEYEALRSGKCAVLELNSFDELPCALIRARIAAGLSQKELGERLGLKEQQIQRYEATEYASASLARIQEVIRVLNVRVREEVFLPNAQISLDTLLRRLQDVGLERDFVFKRLLPQTLVAKMHDENLSIEEGQGDLAIKAASLVGRVYGWTPAAIFNADSSQLNTIALQEARFKMPARASEKRTSAYTVYAHYLALLVLQVTPHLEKQKIPTDPNEVRETIVRTYGSITFETALRYVWSLGVPVLPLKDPGAFHGACWRVDGKNIIVLKQRTKSAARWLFDLKHEIWHIGQEPEQDELSIIEINENAHQVRGSKEEIEASRFAGNVLLNGRAEELAELCVEQARGSVERLKHAVPIVAQREGVAVDLLANYMAFRLSLQGINWWGAATNLQIAGEGPWQIARDIFLEQTNWGGLNEIDRGLLMQALTDAEV